MDARGEEHTSQVDVTSRSSMEMRRVYGFWWGGGYGGGRSSGHAGLLKYYRQIQIPDLQYKILGRLTSNISTNRCFVLFHRVDGASSIVYRIK